MNFTFKALKERFSLNIESPFSVEWDGQLFEFECLIKGYGAENGMIVDGDWKKIRKARFYIEQNQFGYSCFEIEDIEDIDEFGERLDDWGKTNA